jgi:Flp pilus assembly protein TadG
MNAPVKRRWAYRRNQGATTVEFAFVAPIIILLFLGAIEVTRLNYLRHSAANAAYVGARKIVVPGGINSEAVTVASEYLNLVRAGAGAQVDVVRDDETVSVTVTIPVEQNAWGILKFSTGIEISNTCTLTCEQVQ